MTLNLMAGNSDGNGAIFRVDTSSISLSKRLVGGHKCCIRGATHHGNILYTVGEDSRLCEWVINDQQKEVTVGGNTSPDISSNNTGKQSTVGPARKSKIRQAHNPY